MLNAVYFMLNAVYFMLNAVYFMLNPVYFMLNAVYFMITFLSWFFVYVEKLFDKKVLVSFKIHDVTDWATNNYNTHIAQYLKK